MCDAHLKELEAAGGTSCPLPQYLSAASPVFGRRSKERLSSGSGKQMDGHERAWLTAQREPLVAAMRDLGSLWPLASQVLNCIHGLRDNWSWEWSHVSWTHRLMYILESHYIHLQ